MTRTLNLLAALSLGASLLCAQHNGATGTAPTAAQTVASRVARLTVLLTLTTQQQADATTIFTTEQTALAAIRTNRDTAETALDAAITAANLTAVNTAATQLGTLEAQEIVAEATANIAFFKILIADQQTKFSQLRLGGLDGPGPGGHH